MLSVGKLTVIVCPPGPLPKKAGLLLVTTSPSFRLSKITLVGVGVPETGEKENLDSFVMFSGRLRVALGTCVPFDGSEFLKS